MVFIINMNYLLKTVCFAERMRTNFKKFHCTWKKYSLLETSIVRNFLCQETLFRNKNASNQSLYSKSIYQHKCMKAIYT